MMDKTYSELMRFSSFEDRFKYLQVNQKVGDETFGSKRYLNQDFYKTKEWKDARNYVIVRDNGCDLAIPDYKIYGRIYIHHLNPITYNDIKYKSKSLIDPENLICVSYNTHNALHYSDGSLLVTIPKERTPNDTCPWKK